MRLSVCLSVSHCWGKGAQSPQLSRLNRLTCDRSSGSDYRESVYDARRHINAQAFSFGMKLTRVNDLYLHDGAQFDVVLSSHRKSCVIHGRLMYESQGFFSFKLDFLACHPFLSISGFRFSNLAWRVKSAGLFKISISWELLDWLAFDHVDFGGK